MKELRDKRNKLLKDAQALLVKDGVTADEMTSAKRMIEEADAIEERVGQLESVASKIAADEALPKIPRGDVGSGNGTSADEARDAFANFVRFGDNSPVLRTYTPTDAQKEQRSGRRAERRDLTTGATSGGYFVPQEFYPVLTQAEKAWGSILPELNNKKTDNGAPMKIAFSNDTGNLLMLDSEPSSMSEVEPGLSSLLLSTDALKTNIIKVTIAELQDSAFDPDAFIRDIFGKRYYRGLTSLVTNGTWSSASTPVAQNIESLLTAAANESGVTANGGSVGSPAVTQVIAWADIVALYGALDPAYEHDAIWSFNSKTRALLLGVTDSLGRPLYIPAPTAGTFDTILGKRVVLNQYMPDAADKDGDSNSDAVSMLYGDFKQGYLLREVKPGLAIVRLNERFMDTLEVGFLGYCRAGGVSTDAGTHPIVALTQK